MDKRTLGVVIGGIALGLVAIALMVARYRPVPLPPDTQTQADTQAPPPPVEATVPSKSTSTGLLEEATDAEGTPSGPAADTVPEPDPMTAERDAFDVPEGSECACGSSKCNVAPMKAIDALPDRASAETTDGLRYLLNKTGGSESIRNTVANKLRTAGDQRLVADLTKMIWDERETPKWRNYCVQQLYACHEKSRDRAIIGTLFKAADPAETDEKMVRTCAIWSLARAATPRDNIMTLGPKELDRTRALSLNALREKDADPLITMAGVQSSARLGLKEALADIRRLAEDKTQQLHLRVVSVAAIGDLGDDSDLALLDRLAAGPKGRLTSAATFTAKRIRKRIKGID